MDCFAPLAMTRKPRQRVASKLNGCSGNSEIPSERSCPGDVYSSLESEEDNMKKFGYVAAALGAIAIALPSIASAETVVAKHGGYHHGWDRARAEYRVHRDWHPWHRHDRVVIREHRD